MYMRMRNPARPFLLVSHADGSIYGPAGARLGKPMRHASRYDRDWLQPGQTVVPLRRFRHVMVVTRGEPVTSEWASSQLMDEVDMLRLTWLQCNDAHLSFISAMDRYRDKNR